MVVPAQFEKVLRDKVDVVFDLVGGDTKEAVVPRLEGSRPSRRCHPARIAGRDCVAPCVWRDDEARAASGRSRQNRATAGRGDDKTRRRDRVRAPRCGQGLEGHRREHARGSWDVAEWAGSGETQVTRQDRASSGLDISHD